MKKRLISFAVIMLFAFSLGIMAKKAEITIKKTGAKKSAVTFNHDKHKKAGKKCKTCHHVGKFNKSCAAKGCHQDKKKDRMGKRIHETCIKKCHKANKKKGAPTKCNKCHK